jgi:hypothetical protein
VEEEEEEEGKEEEEEEEEEGGEAKGGEEEEEDNNDDDDDEEEEEEEELKSVELETIDGKLALIIVETVVSIGGTYTDTESVLGGSEETERLCNTILST